MKKKTPKGGSGKYHLDFEKMSPFCCSCNAHVSQVAQSWISLLYFPSSRANQQPPLAFRSLKAELYGQRIVHVSSGHGVMWTVVGGSRASLQPEVARISHRRKRCAISASCLTSSQIAANAFTWGTVAVLPFYTLMVGAPNARLTKRAMESCIPYVVLGVLYAYLLYLSWSPDTLRLMFASKYWLPELAGIARMFWNEMTVASAWIHLLAVDLFAARQVFHDGIRNKIETRHSVSLCLLFCPIGIAMHAVTKLLKRREAPSH